MDQNNAVVTYQAGSQEITLNAETVRQYLVNGGGNVTDQEVMMFLKLCEAQKLNPFIKDAYLIKYGNQPATTVVSKDLLTKRAMRNPQYDGMKAGVIVKHTDGTREEIEGSMCDSSEDTLLGGWAEVKRKDVAWTFKETVSFDEYAGKKSDGTLNSTWAKMPGTMIRKVALAHALREAFPEEMQGLYDQSEMGICFEGDKVVSVDAEKYPDAIEVEATEVVNEKTGEVNYPKNNIQESYKPDSNTAKEQGRWACNFDGKDITFKRTWGNHEFTDDECRALANGETISFETTNKDGKPYTATGKLEKQRFEGKDGRMIDFYGFKANFENKESLNKPNNTPAQNNGYSQKKGYSKNQQPAGTMLQPGQYACNFEGAHKTYNRFYGSESLTKEAIAWIIENEAFVEVEGKNGCYLKADAKRIPDDLAPSTEKPAKKPSAYQKAPKAEQPAPAEEIPFEDANDIDMEMLPF